MIGSNLFGFAGNRKCDPAEASARNALTTSPPLSAAGAATDFGMWRRMTQIKIIEPRRVAINLRRMFRRIPMPEPNKATPAKYIQNTGLGIQEEHSPLLLLRTENGPY